MANKRPTLKVVFDTSVLFTQVASDLVRADVGSLIADNSNHSDLSISWHLPDVVCLEREYQMFSKSTELLPNLAKLEKVLGHNLNINEQIIASRVKALIDEQLKSNQIEILKLDTDEIEWKRLISDAAWRRPPFDPQTKEKGFRDSLIAEAFLQLVQSSPKTPSVCRVVLVAQDKLLRDAVDERTKNNANVRTFSTTEELREFISTLVSQVSEDYVKKLTEIANKYFFEKDKQDSLYYKEKLGEKLRKQFSAELAAPPSSDLLRENGTWYISQPRFQKKEGRRISWVTRITVEATAYKYGILPAPSGNDDPLGLLTGINQPGAVRGQGLLGLPPPSMASGPTEPISWGDALSRALRSVPTKQTTHKGKTIFEIDWSVNVNQHRKLSMPNIDSMRIKETLWEPQEQ